MLKARAADIGSMKYVLIPREEFERLSLLDERNRFTRADLAKRYGVSRSMLVRKPWLLPGCDVKTKGIRSWRWTREEVEEWEAIPEKERIRIYETLCNGGDKEGK